MSAVWLLAVLLLMLPCPAWAQLISGSPSPFVGAFTPDRLCLDVTNADTGLSRQSAGLAVYTNCSTTNYATLGNGGVRLQAAGVAGWSSTTDATAAADVGWSRSAAGVAFLGNGTAADRTGTIGAAKFTTTGTATRVGITVNTNDEIGGTASWIQYGSGMQLINSNWGNTSGGISGVLIGAGGFVPPSGSASFAALHLNPIINGTSSGTAYGLGVASKTNVLTGGTIKLASFGTTTTDLFTGYTALTDIDTTGLLKSTLYGTMTNCSSSASPAVCAAAPAGSVVIAAAAASVVVNTTAVTANSQIFVTIDRSLGTKLTVTCDTTSDLTTGSPAVTARTAATSFTIAVPVAPAVNPMCLSYFIVN